MTGILFCRIRKPTATALMRAGRKSKPINTDALPSAMAVKVPIIMLSPPVNGPRIMPMIGASASDTAKEPVKPTIGPRGITLRTA